MTTNDLVKQLSSASDKEFHEIMTAVVWHRKMMMSNESRPDLFRSGVNLPKTVMTCLMGLTNTRDGAMTTGMVAAFLAEHNTNQQSLFSAMVSLCGQWVAAVKAGAAPLSDLRNEASFKLAELIKDTWVPQV